MKQSSESTSRRSRTVLFGLMGAAAIGLAGWAAAADHRDSLALTADPAADIADVYAFRSPANPANLVLAMTVSGLMPPSESAIAAFDGDVLYQFKIDNTGDAVEDLVIQAFVTGGQSNQVMHFRGPGAPDMSGSTSTVLRGPETGTVRVSRDAEAITTERGGLVFFAGVRDDPFFFDFTRFQMILAGQASGFRNPGIDTFAATNVLAIVVEVPISLLGNSPDLRIWGTTSRTAN